MHAAACTNKKLVPRQDSACAGINFRRFLQVPDAESVICVRMQAGTPCSLRCGKHILKKTKRCQLFVHLYVFSFPFWVCVNCVYKICVCCWYALALALRVKHGYSFKRAKLLSEITPKENDRIYFILRPSHDLIFIFLIYRSMILNKWYYTSFFVEFQ